MRILFVVQRYGVEVAGGAEQCCRAFASRLAARGHEVEVLTSCAVSYVDWADAYPAGTDSLEGVVVHRLPVRRPRDHRLFGPLMARVIAGRKPVPYFLQEEWMRLQGPEVRGLVPFLEARAAFFDVVGFFTYLYHTTYEGLPVASRLAPTVLHPTAHDEPPLRLPLFDVVFRHPHAFGFLTEEEEALVRRRFRVRQPGAVVGVGVDLGEGAQGSLSPDGLGQVGRQGFEAWGGKDAEEAFRRAYGLGTRPYALFVGRVDPHKGSEELFGFFLAYKRRHPGELALVVLGETVQELPFHPDVVVTGFVPEWRRRGALAGATLVVVPSYFESFSMVLAEAWAARKPALVNGVSEVLVGQARRSKGALVYRGFAEFEACLEMLEADPALREALGEAGRAYVERRYRWETVLDRYEALLHSVSRRRPPGA